MQWPTNYYKLITGTMFTLFFAGDTYAPNQKVAGKSIQQYLQSNYLLFLRAVAKTVAKKDNVIGFGESFECMLYKPTSRHALYSQCVLMKLLLPYARFHE
jgi:hypothetical protein